MAKKQAQRVRTISCPYCAVQMTYSGAHKLQLGRYGLFLGHLDNFFSGSLDVQIYECPQCGKIEMFRVK